MREGPWEKTGYATRISTLGEQGLNIETFDRFYFSKIIKYDLVFFFFFFFFRIIKYNVIGKNEKKNSLFFLFTIE